MRASLAYRPKLPADVVPGDAPEKLQIALEQQLERLRDWAELASDWFWEQDENLRFTFFSERANGLPAVPFNLALGKTRFEIGLLFESETHAIQHQADLNARREFRNLELREVRSGEAGQILAVSGRPLFDGEGRFRGYRGVTRDITNEKRMLAELADHEQLLGEIIDASANPIVVKDQHYRFIIMNDAACKFLKRPREALVGKTDFDIFPEETARRFRETDNEVLHHGGPVEYEGFYPVPEGPHPWMFVRKSAFTRSNGDKVIFVAITDLTARRKTETALLHSERRFRDIAEAAGEYVWEAGLQGRFSYVSPRVEKVLGYRPEEMVGKSFFRFLPFGEMQHIRRWMTDNETAEGAFRDLEHRFIAKSGEVRWLRANGVIVRDDHGLLIGRRGTTSDITERKKAEHRIAFLANRDPLTELANRSFFQDRLSQAIRNAARRQESLAVMFLDLDRFKIINDSLGHHVGDLMLKEVSKRLLECVRKIDTVARLGGDEFIILIEGLSRDPDAENIAFKILRALAHPIPILEYELHTSCSIGAALFPRDGDTVEALLKHADLAMYAAKERGRGSFQFFNPEMNRRASRRHHLESALRTALAREEFLLHYQPQVDIRTGTLEGIEALLRWSHPEEGLIPPGEFIGVAEETGLIRPLGEWVLRTACGQNKRWQEAGFTPVKMAVNVSAGQFVDPKLFGESLLSILASTGLDPHFLELEMTESLLLQNDEENLAALNEFAGWGLRIAVDDFGTGYSSLAYLKQLPVDSVKIDRSFVRDIQSAKDDAAIVRAIIAMAHSLNLRVVAEGVETQGQLETLGRMGCDEYQGYLLSNPVPAERFAELFLRDAAKNSALRGLVSYHSTVDGIGEDF